MSHVRLAMQEWLSLGKGGFDASPAMCSLRTTCPSTSDLAALSCSLLLTPGQVWSRIQPCPFTLACPSWTSSETPQETLLHPLSRASHMGER